MSIPTAHTDPINARILAVSEDRIQGFERDPFGVIAEMSGLEPELVMERIKAMMEAGTIRRVCQTLMATKLAESALVAWQFPDDRLDAAFDFMFREDPFSGYVTIRSTDAATPGSDDRLWTMVNVPRGYSVERHCAALARMTGAEGFRVIPAVVTDTAKVELSDLEWQVLAAVKRELEPGEVTRDFWEKRADEAGLLDAVFFAVAENLDSRGVIGRFSTLLERDAVLAHKKAIDEHLAQAGIPVSYTNVFWGGRSEIKPGEISPFAYREWCESRGIDPQSSRD